MKRGRAIAALLSLLVSMVSLELSAHALGQSYVFLTVDDADIDGRFEITVDDLSRALGTEFSDDQQVTLADLEPSRESIESYYLGRVVMFLEGRPLALTMTDMDLTATSFAQYVRLHFSLPSLSGPADALEIDYRVLFDLDSDHRALLVVENNWKTGTFNEEANIRLTFNPENTRQTLDFRDATITRGVMEMVKLGTHHIWEGIDHVLFLIALLLPSVLRREQGKWRATPDFRSALIQVVKIVTVFTVAHTITLSSAVLGVVSLPSRLVESVIAISIAVAALDVLYPIFRGRIWYIVFAFGLFHGFGFASVLGEMGIPGKYMVYSLLAFNIGVELGQVAIVAVIFPLLYLMRNAWLYREVSIRVGATALIIVSLYWFLERGFAIDLPAGEYAGKVLGVVGLEI